MTSPADRPGRRGPAGGGGPLSRRQFLLAGAGAVGALALAACTSSAASNGGGSSAPGKKSGQPVTATYRSRPDLTPPLIEQTGPTGTPAAGYVCVTPTGPMLVDDDAEPVWIHPVPHSATNFRVQQFQGKPVLTWWQGEIAHYGVGIEGEYVVLDQSYRRLMTVRGREGVAADLHEFIIDANGVAYFTAYRKVAIDLRAVGGPAKGTAVDATIQGVDLSTGKLVFDWRSNDHIALTESYAKYATAHKNNFPFDPVHVNSIEPTTDGKLLVSCRNTWALYKVDPATGDIIWRLGGKKSDFTLGSGVRFAWQHDARWHKGGKLITLFDDEGDPPEAKQSRALFLTVDENAKTVSVARQYLHPKEKLLAGSQGSVQIMPNGDVFVGWGAKPYYTEYRADGTVVLDAKFAKGESYRALRFPWTGTPGEQPAVAAQHDGTGVTAYASWNGSTETASWEVVGGSHPGILAPVGGAQKTGFETSIPVQGSPKYLAVRAIDAQGNLLAVSKTIKTEKQKTGTGLPPAASWF